MFGKHSTRTRTSLEVGIYQMGAWHLSERR